MQAWRGSVWHDENVIYRLPVCTPRTTPNTSIAITDLNRADLGVLALLILGCTGTIYSPCVENAVTFRSLLCENSVNTLSKKFSYKHTFSLN